MMEPDDFQLEPRDERRSWYVFVLLFVASFAILASLTLSWQNHTLVEAVRAEQTTNTKRIQDTAEAARLVLALTRLSEHNHISTYQILVAICDGTPGCIVPKDHARA